MKIGDRVSLRHRFGDTIRAHEGVVRKIDNFKHPSGHKDVWLEDFPDLICTDKNTTVDVLVPAKRTLKAGDTVTGEELSRVRVNNEEVLLTMKSGAGYLWNRSRPNSTTDSAGAVVPIFDNQVFNVVWVGK